MSVDKTLFWLTVLGIAFGIIEASVVIYLRELFYPNGFGFPVVLARHKIVLTDIIREMATLLLIGAVALLAGKSRLTKMAVFAFVFAVWDIVYYINLKLMLGWPASFGTWDILFLLPAP